ncbi:arsenate reductase (glutaredoxin) [Bacteroidia bacterium]|jgi:arsenate reductase|nr:arsenate reductase (glutaredoxin) [Bacteroidota bacterium]MDB4174471.1 arsenate reductase (glutaredoxin) [Bacteroidia bacterium]
MKLYHNNRCSKSRQCLALMPKEGVEIIDYIKNPLTKDELSALIRKLGITPIELVRKGEAIWKENYKGKDLTDAEIIDAMVANPKLIERPIVETDNKALVCRPPELVLEMMK